jgi:hypothetical protein
MRKKDKVVLIALIP